MNLSKNIFKFMEREEGGRGELNKNMMREIEKESEINNLIKQIY